MMQELLKKYFGYDKFRPLQEEIIQRVLDRQDCLVLMPTGGGKSLCYQLPALAFEGITVVISPLISLMKDQVDQLHANGVSTGYINSSLSADEIAEIQTKAVSGELKILYIAPERIATAGFIDFLHTLQLSLIAIDEAHCISEWGHDFRPDYRNLKVLREIFPTIPVIALTATATEKVRADIVLQLNLRESKTFISSFDRPNLTYHVPAKKDLYGQLIELLDKYRNESVIIYCFSRKDTEKLAQVLTMQGFKARAYHAGLEPKERSRIQDLFIKDEINIIAATIAFGMGIDKPDVRLVVHTDLPKSVESYYQETGRAGRDSLPSECVLFFSPADKRKHAFFINQIDDEIEREKSWEKLEQVLCFGDLKDCRRKYLLGYFGENYQNTNCNACDLCLKTHDKTVEAKYDDKLFSLLRDLRKKIADELGMPPYIIFGNKALQEMATYYPQSPAALLNISGVGNQKLVQFGEVFLKLIREYAQINGYLEIAQETKRAEVLGPTHYLTKDLVRQKLSIDEIARTRSLVVGTVIDHIEKITSKDKEVDIEYLRPDSERFEKIREAFRKSGGWNLTPAREILGENFSFDELRLARIFLRKL